MFFPWKLNIMQKKNHQDIIKTEKYKIKLSDDSDACPNSPVYYIGQYYVVL